jgi:hypothetical protein
MFEWKYLTIFVWTEYNIDCKWVGDILLVESYPNNEMSIDSILKPRKSINLENTLNILILGLMFFKIFFWCAPFGYLYFLIFL